MNLFTNGYRNGLSCTFFHVRQKYPLLGAQCMSFEYMHCPANTHPSLLMVRFPLKSSIVSLENNLNGSNLSFNLQAVSCVTILLHCPNKYYVYVFTSMWQLAILKQPHLLNLLHVVFIHTRHQWISVPIVSKLKLHTLKVVSQEGKR